MAINKITQPDGGASTDNADYTQQNLLTQAALNPLNQVFTDWTSTAAAPAIAQGTYFQHAGETYETQSSDETISGTVSAGINYVKLSVSGSTLTAAWTQSLAGYTYNEAYQGWYSGTDQIIMNAVYLDGTTYNRCVATNKMPYQFTMADGRMLIDNKNIITTGSGINFEDANLITAGAISSGGDVSITTAGKVLKNTDSNYTGFVGTVISGIGLAGSNLYNALNTYLPNPLDSMLLNGYLLIFGGGGTYLAHRAQKNSGGTAITITAIRLDSLANTIVTVTPSTSVLHTWNFSV